MSGNATLEVDWLMNPHEYADKLGLALDSAVAAKIHNDPSVVDRARENLARWRKENGGTLALAHEEWEKVLRFLTAAQVADFLVSRTAMAARLSQSSPFAGVLNEEERQGILGANATTSA